MPYRCSKRGIGIAIFWLVLGPAGYSNGAEPRATFTVKDGFVKIVLQRSGKPVSAAIVRVFDEHGGQFAGGETGDEGQGLFPQPRNSFTVEFKIGDRIADPIRFHVTGEGIEPEIVLLTFGLHPCCRAAARSEMTDQTPLASLLVWISLTAVGLATLWGIPILVFRRSTPSTLNPRTGNCHERTA